MKKWICDLCGEEFKTKRELVEHLESEADEGDYLLSRAEGQLEELKVVANKKEK